MNFEHPELQEMLNLGCSNPMKVMLAFQSYMHLCEVDKLHNVKYFYNSELDMIYLSSTNKRKLVYHIPIPAQFRLSPAWINNVSTVLLKENSLAELNILLKTPDSTILSYKLTDGLCPPPTPESTKEKKALQEKIQCVQLELHKRKQEFFEEAKRKRIKTSEVCINETGDDKKASVDETLKDEKCDNNEVCDEKKASVDEEFDDKKSDSNNETCDDKRASVDETFNDKMKIADKTCDDKRASDSKTCDDQKASVDETFDVKKSSNNKTCDDKTSVDETFDDKKSNDNKTTVEATEAEKKRLNVDAEKKSSDNKTDDDKRSSDSETSGDKKTNINKLFNDNNESVSQISIDQKASITVTSIDKKDSDLELKEPCTSTNDL